MTSGMTLSSGTVSAAAAANCCGGITRMLAGLYGCASW
jgi:hypothetical protein